MVVFCFLYRSKINGSAHQEDVKWPGRDRLAALKAATAKPCKVGGYSMPSAVSVGTACRPHCYRLVVSKVIIFKTVNYNQRRCCCWGFMNCQCFPISELSTVLCKRHGSSSVVDIPLNPPEYGWTQAFRRAAATPSQHDEGFFEFSLTMVSVPYRCRI